MQPQKPPANINLISANKLFNILQQAEIASHLAGTTRRAYLLKHRGPHVGQVRRELNRIIDLGEAGCDLFFDYFLNEYGIK